MDTWHYADESGAQSGPVSLHRMRELFNDGKVDGLTLVWCPGMSSWRALGETNLRSALLCEGGAEPEGSSSAALSSSLPSLRSNEGVISDVTPVSWLYARGGAQEGPISSMQLTTMLASGELPAATLVWRQGMESWLPASQLHELTDVHTLANEGSVQSGTSTLAVGVIDAPATGVKRSRAQMESAESDRAGAAARSAQASAHLDALADAHDRQARLGSAVPVGDDDNDEAGPRSDNALGSSTSASSLKQSAGRGGRGGRGGRTHHQQKHREQTWVYVTGLPADITVSELVGHFKRAGVVAMHYETGEPRVKIYRTEPAGAASASAGSSASADPPAQPCKGDASVCYLKEASVELAVTLLDGVELRPGVSLHVEPASFAPKAPSAAGAGAGAGEGAGAGDGGGTGKGKDGNANANAGRGKKRILGSVRGGAGGAGASSAAGLTKEQAAAARAREAAQKAALSWAEEGDESLGMHIIVLRHLFTPEDMADPAFAEEFEEDVAGEALRFGTAEKLNIFSKHPDGIVQIKYASAGAAAEALQAFDGRFFGGRRISAEFWDGVTNFLEDSQHRGPAAGGAGTSRSDRHDALASAAGAPVTTAAAPRPTRPTTDQEEEESKRLDAFGAWLESGGDSDANAPTPVAASAPAAVSAASRP